MTIQLPDPSRSPGAQPAAGTGSFARVAKGYDVRQVDEHLQHLWTRIRELEERLARAGGDLLHQAESSPAARKAIGDLMQLALDEITGQRAAADAEIAQLLSDARMEAAQVRGAAQQEAAQAGAGAREQSGIILAQARDEAKKLLDDAAAHATAVTEGAQHRLRVLTGIHEDTVSRLAEINQVSGSLIGSERDRGSLAEEVARIAGSPL